MSLQLKLDALKADYQSGRAPFHIHKDIHTVLERAVEEMISEQVADHAHKVGDVAPHFNLSGPDGTTVYSRDLLAKGPLVVTFLRGPWCPFSTLELQALDQTLTTRAVAVSPQRSMANRAWMQSAEVTLPILSDPENDIAATFGVRATLPDYLVEAYRKMGLNFPELAAGQKWTLPIPSRFILDSTGVIRYAEAHADHTLRPDPQVLTSILSTLT
jgi:peroxiredoxin